MSIDDLSLLIAFAVALPVTVYIMVTIESVNVNLRDYNDSSDDNE